MVTRLETLLKQNAQMSKKRADLSLLQRDLWAEINPLLEEAEAGRKARPSPAAPPQTIGEQTAG